MKNLIAEILADIENETATIVKADFVNVGGCLQLTLVHPGYTLQTTVQRLEIVKQLQLDSFIKGFDPTTGVVYIKPELTCTLSDFYLHVFKNGSKAFFESELRENHLQSALNILEYPYPEELVQFFGDYTLIEKQAWMWQMHNAPHITDHTARTTSRDIMNYFDGTISNFPATVPVGVQFFARWLKRTEHSLFALAYQAQQLADENPPVSPYTQSIA